MARPKNSAAPDLSAPVNLTVGVIQRMGCPPDKQQVFMRDSAVPGLRVRATASGTKAFVFERMVNYRTIRKTIGNVDSWTIEAARAEARRLAVELDRGNDPRQQEQERRAATEAKRAAETADALTVGEAWARYVADRTPHWSERHLADHCKMIEPGGRERRNRPGVKTIPGPITPLLPVRLVDLDAAAVTTWATREATQRPARVRLALRLLKAFLRWAATEPDMTGRADPAAASAKRAQEAAGRAKLKDDVLERNQLSAWFKHVQALPSRTISAYLQTCLLTGARPGEVLTLKWSDIEWQWGGVTIRDKVEGERVIPLTPYVRSLLTSLPKRNEWVFASTRAVALDAKNIKRRGRRHATAGTEAPTGDVSELSESGHLMNPSASHRRVCAAAGLNVTLHGLRRSFATLTEWLEIPAGVVAQIMGHKPSATAEKHYRRRPLDLLRVHHERIEGWMLEQAGVAFDPSAAAAELRLRSPH